MAQRVVRPSPNGLMPGGDGPLEHCRDVGGLSNLFEIASQARQVRGVVGPPVHQVAEDRLGLVGPLVDLVDLAPGLLGGHV